MDAAVRKELIDRMEQAAGEKRFLENRMLSGEMQLKLMSGYYAVLAAVTAVLSIVRPDKNFHALSVWMTVLLALWVIALCVQKNGVRAQRLRSEQAALMRMMAEAQQEADVERLQIRYIDIQGGEEGISAHERRALQHMRDREDKLNARTEESGAWRPALFGYEKFLYWFAEISMIVIKTLIALAPIAGITLTALGLM